ncbi:hypothetical protein EUGRSUZ_B02368 [Eucalyptus grandis]|uniref:Uncharacterized protein n=2 Tax=Eucalyptus grandis TaxID=71139 RepID=A0ACC3LT80_EUCGR|nr:hypothetical protein EUGRSUZ_B02368 [Eucalyptus grandis]
MQEEPKLGSLRDHHLLSDHHRWGCSRENVSINHLGQDCQQHLLVLIGVIEMFDVDRVNSKIWLICLSHVSQDPE